jgi:hypothetical protein
MKRFLTVVFYFTYMEIELHWLEMMSIFEHVIGSFHQEIFPED